MRSRTSISVALVAMLLVAFGVTGCAGGPSTSSTVTRARLERSLERSYANRYVALSKITDHPGVTVHSLNAHAVCDKGGPTVADTGPGGDWICQIAYIDANVPNPDGSSKVEMNVHSNGCYTAASSTKAVGPLNIVDASGKQVINPAFEFDGCFDPSSSAKPDGTMIIVAATPLPGAKQYDSALTLPVGLVQPNGRNHIPLTLQCADGGDHCTGAIAVTVQGAHADNVSYEIPSGGTKVVHAQLTPKQARDGGLVVLTAHEKTPPPQLKTV